MQFDQSFKHALPTTLPQAVSETTLPVMAERRAAGFSVQFVRDNGRLDARHFSTAAQRDAFAVAETARVIRMARQ